MAYNVFEIYTQRIAIITDNKGLIKYSNATKLFSII